MAVIDKREKKELSEGKRQRNRRKKRMARGIVFLLFFLPLLTVVGIYSFQKGRELGMGAQAGLYVIEVFPKKFQVPEIDLAKELEKKRDKINILVNKRNPLSNDYEVVLETLPDGVNRAAREAYGPLCRMLETGRKEGLSFEICSSYRSVERQTELFEEDLEYWMKRGYSYEAAYEEVVKETMPPGCSEHSTGLAFDIVALDYQMLNSGQELTAENRWLQKHCAEYGFILRYPKGKEEITLINYESWHFRYVGVEAAKYIMNEGITLEEYLEQIKI